MKINRRKFIGSMGASALLLASSRAPIFAQETVGKLKIVIFWANDFPAIDGLNLNQNLLRQALAAHEIVFAGENELPAKLSEIDVDLFINPYGSAFPQEAWLSIFKYLQAGGNFLNLGGVPFAVPVRNLKTETRQVNFHKRLGITQSFAVEASAITSYEQKYDRIAENSAELKPSEIYELYLKLSNVNDFPAEAGSDGRREARVNTLICGLDKNNRCIAAPVIQLDRLRGEFAGGRWILANFKGEINSRLIRNLSEIAAFGAIDFSVKTNFSSYQNVESAKCIIQIEQIRPAARAVNISYPAVSLIDPENKEIFSKPTTEWQEFSGGKTEFDLSKTLKNHKPGFYRLKAKLHLNLRQGNGAIFQISQETGFWILDEKLKQSGAPFTADKHFLFRYNEPFPVAGTTYMASDVHRRFLLEANPAVWDKDFAGMNAAGVNMIRTGIWTGWELYFDEKGNVKEEILRAFEAFLLTAKKYEIPVIFTFFAFLPETFGGVNAYLDPQAIEGQKRFLRAFAERANYSQDVIWDLINEPSFANPKNLWSCRPNYDEFEKRAWLKFLKKRFGETDEKILAEICRDRWRLRADENPFELPAMQDFENVNIFVNRRPLKLLEFRLFAQETFKNWAEEMRAVLKQAGNSAQMVTVGQDEAGTNDSPNPQFHAPALDFTCLHNWWSNDDLLWDNVVAKSPNKPNMIQETGIMFYEKPDGSPWRDEKDAANLLERKMALALGANGCGFIQWIWNTNPFMDNENEAAIGFHRADGTAKKELESFGKIAKFANENRKLFAGKKDEKTLLVIPHSQMFSVRNFAGEATRRAVRAFHYHCRHTLRAVSEYNLAAITETPDLILLPSARILTDEAWENLLRLAAQGSIVGITGFIEENEHFQPRRRLGEYFSIDGAVPVAQFEPAQIDGKKFQVRYAGEKIQRVERGGFAQNYVANVPIGKGEILWSRLPLELGETIEPAAAFYNFALQRAKLKPFFSLRDDNPAILVRPTEFENAVLYTCINESGDYFVGDLTHLPTGTKIRLEIPAGQTEMFFVEKRTGKRL